MIDHQLSRRNLHELDKVALLEAKRPILRKQAEDRMKAGKSNPPVNLPEGGNQINNIGNLIADIIHDNFLDQMQDKTCKNAIFLYNL